MYVYLKSETYIIGDGNLLHNCTVEGVYVEIGLFLMCIWLNCMNIYSFGRLPLM